MATRSRGRLPRVELWIAAALAALAGAGGLVVLSRAWEPEPAGWWVEALRGLELVPRRAWSAAAARGRGEPLGLPRRVTLHHTGGASFRSVERAGAAQAVRAIQRDHQERRGWDDIGYHLVIDPAGRLWQGRSVLHEGAHAGPGLNGANLGVALLGNFDLGEPTAAQLATLERVLDGVLRACGLNRAAVLAHDDVRQKDGHGSTECPGKGLKRWLVRWAASAATAEPRVNPPPDKEGV